MSAPIAEPATISHPDVLVAGGGFAALETLIALHERLGASRRVTMLAPDARFRYRPLAAYAGLVPDFSGTIELAQVCSEHAAGFVHDHLDTVDPGSRQVLTRHGGRIDYEALVVAVGAVAIGPIPGAIALGYPRDVPAFEALVERVRAGTVKVLAIVVPPHVRWTLPAYEIALLLRRAAGHEAMKIVITTPESSPMGAFGPEIGEAIEALLVERNVELHRETLPETLTERRLWMPWQGTLGVDAVVALARPVGPIISGLPVDRLGFIPVDRTGRVVGVSGVWAAGDAAAHATKQGGFAMQQADVVAEDVAGALSAERPRAPSSQPPVMRAALVDGESVLYLRAERGAAGWHGVASREPLWWPPSKVAGGRLADYLAAREVVADAGAKRAGA